MSNVYIIICFLCEVLGKVICIIFFICFVSSLLYKLNSIVTTIHTHKLNPHTFYMFSRPVTQSSNKELSFYWNGKNVWAQHSLSRFLI